MNFEVLELIIQMGLIAFALGFIIHSSLTIFPYQKGLKYRFIGRHLSMGLKREEHYYLYVAIYRNGQVVAVKKNKFGLTDWRCPYDSVELFLKNWNYEG